MGMRIKEYRQLTGINSASNRTYTAFASNDKGRAFEEDILTACEFYKLQGIAIVNKVNEPYRVVRKLDGGKFIGIHIEHAEPDFKGVLKGGRAVAFEAKYTGKTRIQKNAVTETQEEWLEEQHGMGALSFVCVGIRDRYFSIPWEVWRDMKDIYGKKYLMPADIPEYEVRYLKGVMFLNRIGKGGLKDASAKEDNDEN